MPQRRSPGLPDEGHQALGWISADRLDQRHAVSRQLVPALLEGRGIKSCGGASEPGEARALRWRLGPPTAAPTGSGARGVPCRAASTVRGRSHWPPGRANVHSRGP